MKKYSLITPEGTRDLLFEECTARREIESKLMELFKAHGFSEVITPFVEFYDTFKDCFSQEEMYKSADSKGRIIVNRPDSTLPIIRLAQTRLKSEPRPLKLCYNQSIYRANPKESGRDDEIAQCGVEIIGGDNENEALALAIKTLELIAERAGAEFRFEIGDCSVFDKLIEEHSIDSEQAEKIRRFVETKNIPALIESKCPEVFTRLPKLFGGDEVFDELGNDALVAKLRSVYGSLDKNATVDLGLTNRHGYYTGLLFNGYIDGYGKPIISGGKYRVNDIDAIGFAVNVSAITQLQKFKNDNTIRIALTKGRLEKETLKLFDKMGWDVSQFADKGRKLIFTIPAQNIEIVLAKAPDVITYVEMGVCDVGITGKDMIDEYGGRYFEMLDLGLGKCRFSLIANKGADFYEGHGVKNIASKYTGVTRRFFEEKGMDVNIVKIEGSVELTPLIGLADGIVDIVETGATLRENGLEIIEDISNISARVIVNPVKMKLKKEQINSILSDMETVI